MSTTARFASVLMASASTVWIAATPALAQDAPPPKPTDVSGADTGGDETVIVTARRRSETLFQTPATVTAVSGATLRKLGISDVTSMIQLIPNAVIPQDPENFNTYINIRGIRQADPQAEPNFGLYRNGIYDGGQRSNLGAQVDVERIEVLRGPQAGLYGRDAVGGAFNIIYATPTDQFGGYTSASYARYGRSEVQGAVNLPVADDFAVRVAAWYFNQKKGEFYNETLDEQIDRSDDQGARLSAKLDINAALSVLWIAEYQTTDGPSARTFAPDGVTNSVFGLPITTDPETPLTTHRDTPSREHTHQIYLSQDVKYETDIGTFDLLAAYRNYRLRGTEDADYTDFAPSTGPGVLSQALSRDEKVENEYVELEWSSPQDRALTWVGGVSYFHEQFDFTRIYETGIDFDYLGVIGFPPLGTQYGFGALPGPGTTITTDSYSAYVDFDYKITNKFSLTAGVRYNSDKKTLNYAQYVYGTEPSLDYLQILFGSSVPTFSLHDSPTFTHTSPSVGFHYSVNDNINLYGLYSDGFRAGGFNTTSTSPTLIPFGSEKASNYELGAKSQWDGGRYGLNLAVFYMEQSDLLVQRQDPVVPNPFGFTYLANSGDARTYGAELEGTAKLLDWLSAAGSVGWLDAKYTSGLDFSTPLKGNHIPYTRNWTLNARVDADHPLNDTYDLVGTINYRLEYGGYLDDRQTEKYSNLDKLDASLGFSFHNTRIVGFIDNVFDDRVVQFIFNSGAESESYGRTYGVRITTDF